jgi:hypothetical protein
MLDGTWNNLAQCEFLAERPAGMSHCAGVSRQSHVFDVPEITCRRSAALGVAPSCTDWAIDTDLKRSTEAG